MILLMGDTVPTKSNEQFFIQKDIEHLIGKELFDIIQAADYRILNLETPLFDGDNAIEKNGPNLKAKTSTIYGIKGLQPDLVTLANNHIMDYGYDGLQSTINSLEKNHIRYVGAGTDIYEAQQPVVFIHAGKKIGVYGCAEHEFSIADEKRSGANPFDPLYTLDHVADLKKLCDFIIVLYHGGKEYYRYPSPQLQRACRRLVEKGADIVICQHSHCVGCEERYKQGVIIYGQGNFIFDGGDDEFYKTSLVVSLDQNMSVGYIPIVKYGETIRLADPEQSRDIMHSFWTRSEEIKNQELIERKYTQFAKGKLENYILQLSGTKRSLPYKVCNKITHRLLDRMVVQRYLKLRGCAVMNYIECEAHRELLIEGLKGCKK